MSDPNFVRSKFFSLKNHPTLNERWLHQQLQDDPSLLGLGDCKQLIRSGSNPRVDDLTCCCAILRPSLGMKLRSNSEPQTRPTW